jgi:CheY-like chemotaxis protein
MDSRQPAETLCVLVVDDDRDAASTWCRLLAQWGHRFLVAYDGVEAWAMALGEKPDVVVLDVGLPGGGGWELARRLRAEPALKGIKLIAFTGCCTEGDREMSLEVGIDWHLVKPVDPQLLRRLLVVCGLQRGRPEA